MLTIQAMKDFGADVQDGLGRCMGSEAFYLKLVRMLEKDEHMRQLGEALQENRLDQAFEAAHALKGVLANLALTPVLQPVNEMTELLRSRTEMDYSALFEEADTQMKRLKAIIQD